MSKSDDARRQRERLKAAGEYSSALPGRFNFKLMPIASIADELGVTPRAVRYTLAGAIRKVLAGCRRYGIDAGDIVGRPLSMLAQAEEREWR